MECYVCGGKNIDADGMCCDCGFEMVPYTGDGDSGEYERVMKEMAAEYAVLKRRELSVSIMIFQYQNHESGGLKFQQDRHLYFKMMETPGEPGSVSWLDEFFCRFERPGKELKLELTVHDQKKGDRLKQVKLVAPDWGPTLWKIGLKEETGMNFRVVLGPVNDNTKMLESDRISMVR